jgi:hypothetical protein
MTDNNFLAIRRGLADGYTANSWRDDEVKAAQRIRVTARLGIAVHLLYICTSVYRIWAVHAVLGRLETDGQIGLAGPSGDGLVSQEQAAYFLVSVADLASYLAFVLFLLAVVLLFWRKRRGDALAVAIEGNLTIRVGGFLYAWATGWSFVTGHPFNVGPDSPLADDFRALLGRDVRSIGFQLAVLAVLVLIVRATRREVGKARAEGLIC